MAAIRIQGIGPLTGLPLAYALAVLVALGYALALWWLLRRETLRTWLGLAILSGLALAVRLLYTTDFPTGFYEDEPKTITCYLESLAVGDLFGDCFHLPVLLNGVMSAPFAALFDDPRWAVRGYALAGGVLAVPAAVAASRAFGLHVVSSFAVGGLVAVLPWSLFFSRISLGGGEMIFHQFLLLAALARLIWTRGGVPEVAIGAVSLAALMHGYFSGRAMLGLPLVAVVLARGWRRAGCAAIALLGGLAYLPYLLGGAGGEWAWVGLSRGNMPPDVAADPLRFVQQKLIETAGALIRPTARTGALTMPCAAMHPPVLLALAGLGALTGVRRALLLGGGVLAGLMPSLVSGGPSVSVHRMMMAFAFLPVAAGCALDLLRWRWPRALVASALIGVTAVHGLGTYFSPAPCGWWGEHGFDWESAGVIAALPPPPRPQLVASPHFHPTILLPFLHGPRDYEMLTVENWFPGNEPVLYAFASLGDLRPFYTQLFGVRRVHESGRAFLVTLEAGDWSWLRAHGWTFETRCGERQWIGQVPTLYQYFLGFRGAHCHPVTHRWRGRWNGPGTRLLFRYMGQVTVETPAGRTEEATGEVEFAVEPGSPVEIRLASREPFPYARLLEQTPAGWRVPPWEWVSPLP